MKEKTQSKNSAAFFSPEKKNQTEKLPEPNKEHKSKEPSPGKTNANAQYQLLLSELNEKLNEINKKIQENNKNTKISESDKALEKLDFLNEKFRMLINADGGLSIDKLLFKVIKEINQHHQVIESLFKKKALEGDIATVKSLRGYVSFIDQQFFGQLIILGNVDICEFMIKSFPESIVYLNFCLYYLDEKNNYFSTTDVGSALLQIVFKSHQNSPNFLEMLLRNGANPDFYGESRKNEDGILYLSITNKHEEFVQILLKNGADPNPRSCIVRQKKSMYTPEDCQSAAAFSKIRAQNASQLTPSNYIFAKSRMPLVEAICVDHKNIVALLLQYGASSTEKFEGSFDAIGVATCEKSFLPNMEIVKLLVENGANIDALQIEGNNQMTPLFYACQRNDLTSVEGFIALGANPNQGVRNTGASLDQNKNQILFEIQATPFQKAAMKNHVEIVKFLMHQERQPITFRTAASTLAFLVRSHDVKLSIELSQLNIFFEATPMMYLIQAFLLDGKHYNQDTITAEVHRAYQEGKQYFQVKQYSSAVILFYEALLFGGPEEFQATCFSLGLCFKNLENKTKADFYFTHCLKYDSESKLGQSAKGQLEKLFESGASLTM